MNPGIKNTNKQLYGDLWNNFELDQSNRLFYSTANTRVANDQTLKVLLHNFYIMI